MPPFKVLQCINYPKFLCMAAQSFKMYIFKMPRVTYFNTVIRSITLNACSYSTFDVGPLILRRTIMTNKINYIIITFH